MIENNRKDKYLMNKINKNSHILFTIKTKVLKHFL